MRSREGQVQDGQVADHVAQRPHPVSEELGSSFGGVISRADIGEFEVAVAPALVEQRAVRVTCVWDGGGEEVS